MIANPAATTTSAANLDVITRALRSCLKVDVARTTHRGHAYGLALQARRDRIDVVIALGGDGTVNECVNGLLADGVPNWQSFTQILPPSVGQLGDWENQQEFPLFAVIPGGSTNVFARALGLSGNPIEATSQLVAAVTQLRTRDIGLGKANGRFFTFSAGLGFDAEILAEVERHRQRGKRACARLVIQSGVQCFFYTTDRKAAPLSYISTNGFSDQGVHTIFVANTTPYTFARSRPLTATPEASFDTGLDAVAFKSLTVKDTLINLAKMAGSDRRPLNGNSARSWHDLADLTVAATRPVQWQLDGEPLGECNRVEFSAAARAIRVLV